MAEKAKANEIDVMSIVRVMQNRIFNHNSDRMRFLNSQLDIDDETVKEQGFEAILQAISQDADKELFGESGDADSPKGDAGSDKKGEAPKIKLPTPKKTEKKNPKPRSRFTFSAEVLEKFGVDTSNLPKNTKAILRKGKKDEWTIQLFFYSPAKVYTKIYKIGRFNVPGSDPMNSKRPQTIVEKNPLMPSFCRFYFDSKFAYNLSEENIIRMLESMKCHFPQSTLNKYIHQIMDYLRVRLETLMREVIRSCGFVQNDETRILVLIQLINGLFLVEKESKARGHSPEQRYRFRLKYSASIVGQIMSLLKKMKGEKDKYGALVMKAINYILDDEEAFKKFLHDGRIEMHNNAVESVFRHIAMGRRNWLNSGSHEAAQNIAFMYSLYESCKMNDIDFGEYVEDILTRMMNGDNDYESMIPCRSSYARLLPTGRKNYVPGQKQEKKVA